MSYGSLSWKNYEGVDGFGRASADEVAEIHKALAVGSDRDPPGSFAPGDGFALRVESLERTMRNATFAAKHLRIVNEITKVPAYNTQEEYNVRESYGQAGVGLWMRDGELPEETDGVYERRFAQMKFLGTTRRVTLVSTLVKSAIGNLVADYTLAGTMTILQALEKAIFFGDSSVDPDEFDGLEALIRAGAPATHIIDLRGAPLSEDVLVDGALTINDAPAYGTPTDLYANPKALSDLNKSFFPKARYDLMTKPDGKVGLSTTGFISPAGDVRFQSDTFITDGGQVPTAAAGDTDKIPLTPAVTAQPAAGLGAAPLWTAGTGSHDAGTYIWHIAAANRYGMSVPVATNALAVTAGLEVEFDVTPVGARLPTHYVIWRTTRGGASAAARFIVRVANTAGAGALTITDLNASLPGTTKAFMLEQTGESMALSQLAPMVKIPLAQVEPSIRWMQLAFCTVKLYLPRHQVLYVNIGRSADFVGTP